MTRRFLMCALMLAVAAGTASARTSRTLEVELEDADRPFTVENLAGSMSVIPWDGDRVVAVARVTAANAGLADQVSFEQVRGRSGRATLRVRYPVRRHRTFRYPEGGSSTVTYDGRRVRVSGRQGVLLYADVEVKVPRSQVDAVFKNHVGPLAAEGITGTLRLDTGSGRITARDLEGRIKADTGSGAVEATGIRGEFVCDTGSGSCLVNDFDGTRLTCDTGSGRVRMRGIRADRVVADTGSGSVVAEDADVVDFRGDTGSGSIRLEAVGSRLQRVSADTGSGGVTVSLPAGTTFRLNASVGSGRVRCDVPGAETIQRGRRVVGCRLGDERVRITADTGSGSVTVTTR